VVKDTPYLIDPCMRAPCPGIDVHLALWKNLGEVMWHGAVGELIDLEPEANFGVEVMMHHKDDPKEWRCLKIPDDARPWVKLFGACKRDDLYCVAPLPHSTNTIGAVVGIGDTLEAAIKDLQDHIELVKDQPVDIDIHPVQEMLEMVMAGEEKGIEFTKQEIPEPSEVL
jgi:hypothetical protein